jgi:hypothetical protein
MKFKHPFVALGGLAAIAVGAPLLLPHIGFGSSAGRLTAPTNQPQNVNVVNTPTVGAQQSGTWNVGINGTPTVGLDVGNNTVKIDTASPLPVRDADEPARTAFQAMGSGDFDFGSNQTTIDLTTVPAGKRLVIQYVSATMRLPNGHKFTEVSLFTAFDGNGGVSLFLVPSLTASDANSDYFAASQPVFKYAGAGTLVTARLFRDSAGVGVSGAGIVAISGYLIDCGVGPGCAAP